MPHRKSLGYYFFSLLIVLTACTDGDMPTNMDEEPVEREPVFSFNRLAEHQFPFMNLTGLAVSDINQDGMKDLVAVTQEVAVLGILEAAGDEKYSLVLDTMETRHKCCISKVSLLDLNTEGYPEAVVSHNTTSGGLDILSNQQNGRFQHQKAIELKTSSAVREMIRTDFSGDQLPDIAINRHFGQTSIFINNGTGGFAEEIEIVTPDNGMYTYMGITAGDFDQNQTMDLAHVSEDGIFISLLSQETAIRVQSQTEILLDRFSRSLATGDINGDGYSDIVTSVGVLLNEGDGQNFTLHEDYSFDLTTAVATADIDQDGRMDILVADGYDRELHLIRNNGKDSLSMDISLELEENKSMGGHTSMPYNLLVEDLNGDGWPDIAVSSFFSSKVFIFLNLTNN